MKNEPGIVYYKHFIVCLALSFPTLGPTYSNFGYYEENIF